MSTTSAFATAENSNRDSGDDCNGRGGDDDVRTCRSDDGADGGSGTDSTSGNCGRRESGVALPVALPLAFNTHTKAQ